MATLTNEQKNFYRDIGGLPVTLLLIIYQMGGRAGRNDLVDATHKSPPTVEKALSRLVGKGLIERRQRYSGYYLTNQGRQLPLFDAKSKFFISPPNSSINIQELIKRLSTITIDGKSKFFTSPEMDTYLSGIGVWPNMRPEIAEILSNSVEMAEKYFTNQDTKLAIWQIRNNIPPPLSAAETEKQSRDKYFTIICRECGAHPCQCDDETDDA